MENTPNSLELIHFDKMIILKEADFLFHCFKGVIKMGSFGSHH